MYAHIYLKPNFYSSFKEGSCKLFTNADVMQHEIWYTGSLGYVIVSHRVNTQIAMDIWSYQSKKQLLHLGGIKPYVSIGDPKLRIKSGPPSLDKIL
jgi:hypothetical protein